MVRLPDIVWCEVEAGKFVMGSDEIGSDEKPRHTLNLSYTYKIAKYPITNIQYGLFIKAGGYTETCRWFWTKAGWAQIIDKWNYSQPYWWDDSRFNQTNQPVNVTWYEAVAFCNWLTEQLRAIGELDEGWVIRLPTEAEWEKAARGTDGRKYPWGNEPPTKEHANYDETDVGTTCAVGLFSKSRSPYRVEGMAGNVWEWCATKYHDDFKPYPYKLEDEWSDDYLAGSGRRNLRGGAFNFNTDYLRAASRDYRFPLNNSNNQGFRLISSPFGSGILPS